MISRAGGPAVIRVYSRSVILKSFREILRVLELSPQGQPYVSEF